MLFNSLEFAFFFTVVYGVYLVANHRIQNALLLVAGYVFYGRWDVQFLFLITFSTVVDYWIGLLLAEGEVRRKERLISSVFITVVALVCLCIDWSGLGSGQLKIRSEGGYVLVGTGVCVLFANLLHPRVRLWSVDRRKKILLRTTVGVNLGFLAIFKYFNFFTESAISALTALGANPNPIFLQIALPVGISFYTFQSLSYTIDISRGLVKPAKRFFDFALFVAYFPPMVAGPIERARSLLPQLLEPRKITLDQFVSGMWLILFGLFMKIAIADGVAPAVNAVYNSSGQVSQGDIAHATVLFAFQIFCDFAGYSNIAIGVSKLLGINLSINFDLPYFSKNPSEFWRRWHISLSSWLRDYLYIPLGGNKGNSFLTYRNLIITMLLGGLWHGAAWNFVLWGLYQGLLLSGHRLFMESLRKNPKLSSYVPELSAAISIPLFFIFTCYGWLLFRASSFEQIFSFTKSLIGLQAASLSSVIPSLPLSASLGLVLLICVQCFEFFSRFFIRNSMTTFALVLRGGTLAAVFIVLLMGMSNAPVQFIYFQF